MSDQEKSVDTNRRGAYNKEGQLEMVACPRIVLTGGPGGGKSTLMHECAYAWRRHPRYVLIDNADRDWQDKARAARDMLTCWLVSANEKGD